MRTVAVCLALIVAVSAGGLQTRFSRYADAGAYAAPAAYDSYRFEEPAAAEQAPTPIEASPEMQQPIMQEAPQEEQPQGNSFVPAIVNHNEEAAPATALPAMPTLDSHLTSEQAEEPTAEEDMLAQDPEIVKLNQALEAVKEDIIANGKQIADERKWVAAVLKITQDYEMKVKRVQDHILELRKTMKTLYEKKKQIENLKLQRALEAKLKQANEELITLQNSLKHVQAKHEELDKSHMDLRSTIASIEAQLAKLKGENPEKADQEEKVEIEEAVEADKLESASEKEEASVLGSEEEKEAMEI